MIGTFRRACEEVIGPFGDRAASYHKFVVLLLAQAVHFVGVEHESCAVSAGNA